MTAPAPRDIALHGLCPRCGARTLFRGPVAFAPHCRACGLDFAQFNVGDGPAAFLTLIVGAIVAGAAVLIDLRLHPPFWVHFLLWPPVTVGLVLALLRVAKGMLLALEYRHKAAEGKLLGP